MHLDSLLALLGGAGVDAAREARRAAQTLLSELIEPHPENPGEFVFKRIPVRLPGPGLVDDDGPLLNIPAWGLLTGGNPDLEEMTCRVRSAVDIATVPRRRRDRDHAGVGRPDTAPPVDDIEVRLRQGPFTGATKIDVSLKFKMGEPPELLESLRDRLAQAMREAVTGQGPAGPASGSTNTGGRDG